MIKKIYILSILSALMVFTVGNLAAQQSGGSIVLTSFGDSTYTTGNAGEFNFTDYEQGQTLNIKGMYGDLATATEVNVNYTIFATDWSEIKYENVKVFANAGDTTAALDGTIDFDYTIPMDADTFGVHDVLDPDTDTLITPAPTFIQVRVWHGPPPPDGLDVFWYEFVRVRPAGFLTSTQQPGFELLEGLEVFPNPAENELTIQTTTNGPKNIMMYDITGKRVLNQEMIGNRLDVSALNSGYHVIRVEEEGKIGIFKVMIK